MKKGSFQHYEHPSDIGIRGVGESREEAFRQAALAMTAAMAEIVSVKPEKEIDIEVEMEDDQLGLVDWLNAILYEISVKKMLFCDFEVSIHGRKLTAKVWGEKIDKNRHKPVVEVKAATYSDLKVEKNKEGNWIAQCIIDV